MGSADIPALSVSTNLGITTLLAVEVDSDHWNAWFDVAAVAKSTIGRWCHIEHELYLQWLNFWGMVKNLGLVCYAAEIDPPLTHLIGNLLLSLCWQRDFTRWLDDQKIS